MRLNTEKRMLNFFILFYFCVGQIIDYNINQNQMNSEKRIGRLTILALLGIFIASVLGSCKKDGPTVAVISVIDSAGRAVQGAAVTLWQDTAVNNTNGVKASLRVTKISDTAGKAEFTFELEAYLNAQAIRNTDTARSVVRLKEHETVNVTLHL